MASEQLQRVRSPKESHGHQGGASGPWLCNYIYMVTGTLESQGFSLLRWPERCLRTIRLPPEASGPVTDDFMSLLLNGYRKPSQLYDFPFSPRTLASKSARCDLLQSDLESVNFSPCNSYKLGDFSCLICKMKTPTRRLWGTS